MKLTQAEILIQQGKVRNAAEYWKLRQAADNERNAVRKMYEKLVTKSRSDDTFWTKPAVVNGVHIQTCTVFDRLKRMGYDPELL